ncbi:hypothetical protein H4R34_001040 [Dimargaris verticillata]|uniref:Shelterin complex subunit TPP1/Est3 domain-containing protein n=1 Tax=Dimargaris verticillata TaxID=2761393 RepID=A0A9W8EE51_9FUNG|nr:hypothetical protein H4R34_001040 [Dimargaris verticillata]
MARGLVRPWLVKSFLDEALGLGEPCTRKRRVQIIKFLDRPPSFSQRDNQPWSVPAQISDSLHWIPAIFSSECVAALEHDRDLLSINGACIIINKYELKAYPQHAQESSDPRFVCLLYITDFNLLGADGSTMIGKPELFNDDSRVKELVTRHAKEYLRNQAYGPLAAGIRPPRPGSEEASQYRECCVSLLTQGSIAQQPSPDALEAIETDERSMLEAYFVQNADCMTTEPPTLHECLISATQWAVLDALPGWDEGDTTASSDSFPPRPPSTGACGVTKPMLLDEPHMDPLPTSAENCSPLSFAEVDSPTPPPTSIPAPTVSSGNTNAIADSLPCSARRVSSTNLWAYAAASYQAHHTLSHHATHQIAFLRQQMSFRKVVTHLSSQDFNFTTFTPKHLSHPDPMDWEPTQGSVPLEHAGSDENDSLYTLSTGSPFSTLASIQRALQHADSNTFHTTVVERPSEWLGFNSADLSTTISRRSSTSMSLPVSQTRSWCTPNNERSLAGHLSCIFQQAPAVSRRIILALMHFPLCVWSRLVDILQHAIDRCCGTQWSQQPSRQPRRNVGPRPQLADTESLSAYSRALLPNSYTAYPDQTKLHLQPLVSQMPLHYCIIRTALGHGASSRRPAHIFRTVCVLTLCVIWQQCSIGPRPAGSSFQQTTQTTPVKEHSGGDSDNSYTPSPNIFASLQRPDTSPRRPLVYTCIWSPFSLHRSLDALGSQLHSATTGSSQLSPNDGRQPLSTYTQENSVGSLASTAEPDTAPTLLDVNLQTLMQLQRCYSSCSPPSPTPTPLLSASAWCSELPPTSSLSPILTGTLPDSYQPMPPTPHANSSFAASLSSDAPSILLSQLPIATPDASPKPVFPSPRPITQSKSMETMSPVQTGLKRAFSDSSLSSNSPHKTPTSRAIDQIQPPLIYQSANRAHKGLLLKRQKLDPILRENDPAPFSLPALSSNPVPELVPARHALPGLKRRMAGPASRSRKPRLAPPSSPSPPSSPLSTLSSSPPGLHDKHWYTTSPIVLGKRNPFLLRSKPCTVQPTAATTASQVSPKVATATSQPAEVVSGPKPVSITVLSHRMARASGMVTTAPLPLDQLSASCAGRPNQDDANAHGEAMPKGKRLRLELSPTLRAQSEYTRRCPATEPLALPRPCQVKTALDSNPPSPNLGQATGRGWRDPDYAVNFDEWDW